MPSVGPVPLPSEGQEGHRGLTKPKPRKVNNANNNRATNSAHYVYGSILREGSFGSVLQATDKLTDCIKF